MKTIYILFVLFLITLLIVPRIESSIVDSFKTSSITYEDIPTIKYYSRKNKDNIRKIKGD